MAITCMDDCTAVDYPRYAGYLGKFTVLLCFVIGIAGCFFEKRTGLQVYAIAMGLLIATLELPIIYAWSEQCTHLNTTLNESFQLKRGWIRGTVYIGISIFMFFYATIQILTGVFLLLTAICYICSSYSNSVDESDRAAAGGMSSTPSTMNPTPSASTYKPVDNNSQYRTF